MLWITARAVAQKESLSKPRPVRNDVAQAGQEVLMLRHQQLIKGSHQAFYEASREGVWPFFEKIGARIVGQWKVIHPDESTKSDEFEEGWRLARYASYEHWAATRRGGPKKLGGNGPDHAKCFEAFRIREKYYLGSDGGHFLQGLMHDSAPLYMPGLDEIYEIIQEGEKVSAQDQIIAVRNDTAQPGKEIVVLRYVKIKKGTFDQFLRASVESVWPFYEKIGARIIGQWKVIYPSASSDTESPDYNEVYTMTRYASYEHWKATRPSESVNIGGNGPDWERMMEAIRFHQSMSLETSVQFLQGYMYSSPPKYMPGLNENYKLLQKNSSLR
jgi:ligand-binding SRPBCC domain-containing protein